jgi:hypothetical protein
LFLKHWSGLTRTYNQQAAGPRKLQALAAFRDRHYAAGMSQVKPHPPQPTAGARSSQRLSRTHVFLSTRYSGLDPLLCMLL